MNKADLFARIQDKKTFLCVGLDTDINKIPKHLLKEEDPVFEFNKRIIDATIDLCVAYKPNLAFYEALGPAGWVSLQKTLDYIPKDIFTIADAKRGDIGSTADMYARAFFTQMDFDAITVNPYMGKDTIAPFLQHKGKWTIILGLTSNESSVDFEELETSNGQALYERVIQRASEWGPDHQMMFVVGATKTQKLEEIRQLIPKHFLLIPGVGAQGGNLEQVTRFGINNECGLLVNSSRGIIYASDGQDFAAEAQIKAKLVQTEMERLLDKYL